MIRRKPLELRVCHTWMQGRVCVGRKDWAEKVLWDLDNGIRSFFWGVYVFHNQTLYVLTLDYIKFQFNLPP